MEIDWWTLGLQAVNFAVLVWLLRRFLFVPVRKVIETRREEAGRALADAAAAKAAAEAEAAKLAETRAAVEKERLSVLAEARKAAEVERQGVLETARAEAAAIEAKGRAAVEEARRLALARAGQALAALAADLAARVLAEEAGQGPAGPLIAALDALPEDERGRLEIDLARPDAGAVLVTASPVDAAAQAAWQARLAPHLKGIRLDFATDPALLGGALLKLPNAVIDRSWAAHLDRAREAMEGHGHA